MKFFLILSFVVVAFAGSVFGCIRPEPEKIMRGLLPEDSQEEVVIACSSSMDKKRHEFIELAKCGAPKDVFVEIKAKAAHEQVDPSGVFVKRCVGLCDYESFGSNCAPVHKVIMKVPVRVYSVKTNQERCVMYDVEEHVSCSCCDTDPCSGPTPISEVAQCTPEHEKGYNENMEKSRCGEPPKDFLIDLEPKGAYEHVYPAAVWVKRCGGHCDYESLHCGYTEKVIKKVPVRVYDLRTNKYSCMLYDVEEHVKCHCCDDQGCKPRPLRRSEKRKISFLISPEEDIPMLPV